MEEENLSFLVFEIAGEEYALETPKIQEIVKLTKMTPLPNTPSFIRGVFNLRGKVILVIDLKYLFGLKLSKGSFLIVTFEKDLGLVADKMKEIITLNRTEVKPTPKTAALKIKNQFLKGVFLKEKRLVIILDLEKIIEETENKKF